MERIKGKDFISQRLTYKYNNDVIAKFLMQLKRFNKFNKIYSNNFDKDGIEFIDSVIDSSS